MQYKKFQDMGFIEMELMEGGSLMAFIERQKQTNSQITEDTASGIIKQVINALECLHNDSLVHRDIKPENILLDDLVRPKVVKISDFGLSVRKDTMAYQGFTLQCGTLLFKAPEQHAKLVYSKVISELIKSIDLWAVGIVTYMLLNSGKHPFLEKRPSTSQEALKLIESTTLSFHNDSLNFLDRLLKKDDFSRYAAFEAVQHPWLTGDISSSIPIKFFEKLQNHEVKMKISKCFAGLILLQKIRANTIKEKEDEQNKAEELKASLCLDLGSDSEIFLTNTQPSMPKKKLLIRSSTFIEAKSSNRDIEMDNQTNKACKTLNQRRQPSKFTVQRRNSQLKSNVITALGLKKQVKLPLESIDHVRNILQRIESHKPQCPPEVEELSSFSRRRDVIIKINAGLNSSTSRANFLKNSFISPSYEINNNPRKERSTSIRCKSKAGPYSFLKPSKLSNKENFLSQTKSIQTFDAAEKTHQQGITMRNRFKQPFTGKILKKSSSNVLQDTNKCGTDKLNSSIR